MTGESDRKRSENVVQMIKTAKTNKAASTNSSASNQRKEEGQNLNSKKRTRNVRRKKRKRTKLDRHRLLQNIEKLFCPESLNSVLKADSEFGDALKDGIPLARLAERYNLGRFGAEMKPSTSYANGLAAMAEEQSDIVRISPEKLIVRPRTPEQIPANQRTVFIVGCQLSYYIRIKNKAFCPFFFKDKIPLANCTELWLRIAFGRFGCVTRVQIPMCWGGKRPKGFAFVTFTGRKAVEEAVKVFIVTMAFQKGLIPPPAPALPSSLTSSCLMTGKDNAAAASTNSNSNCQNTHHNYHHQINKDSFIMETTDFNDKTVSNKTVENSLAAAENQSTEEQENYDSITPSCGEEEAEEEVDSLFGDVIKKVPRRKKRKRKRKTAVPGGQAAKQGSSSSQSSPNVLYVISHLKWSELKKDYHDQQRSQMGKLKMELKAKSVGDNENGAARIFRKAPDQRGKDKVLLKMEEIRCPSKTGDNFDDTLLD